MLLSGSSPTLQIWLHYSLWSGVSPLGLYQDPKASSSSRSGAGDAIGSLHRRQSPDGGVAGERSRSSERLDLPIAMLRFYNKQREDDFGTVPDTGVPGIHGQHSDNGASTTARETQKNSGGVSETRRGGASVSPRPLQVNWQNELIGQSSNTASSTVLQTPTDGSGGGSENIRSGLRGLTRPVCRQQRRADLVGYSHDQVEWQDDVVGGTRHGDRIRRVEPGMGCVLPGHRYGRSLNLTRGGLAHKLPGIAGSNTSAEDVREERDALISATQNRQHDGCCIYQQPRGVPNTRAMDVVPGEEYSHPSAVPSRETESAGRSGIQRYERPIRLEIGSENITKNQQAIRAAGSGLVCIEADPPVPSLFQLAARSICRSHRCFPARLDETERVCQPPWNLIARVLKKVKTQEVHILLITPVWKTQPWYSLLLSMLIDWPRLLPHQTTSSTELTPQLAVWSISGEPSAVRVFQMKLHSLSSDHGEQKQTSHTTHSLGNGIAGAMNGAQILFRDL